MPVQIKSSEEIEKMRVAGKLAGEVLEYLTPLIKAGMSTEDINTLGHDYMVNVQKTIPATLGYRGFTKSLCTSVNHVVCHGIPSADKILKDGDIVNVDVTVIKDGYHGDTSKMFLIGKPSILAERLVRVTNEAMWRGIKLVKPGITFGDIGHAIQSYAEAQHFSIVREYCGHGIGDRFHEDEIQVLHYGQAGTGMKVEAGMTFTIEPMINAGKRQVKLLPDQWTVVTADRSLSAQWEHTILVTDTGYEVLTLREEEKAQGLK